MDPDEQLKILGNIGNNISFSEKLKSQNISALTSEAIDIFQVNTGKRCNLQCRHCHIGAGPDSTETMSTEVLEKCRDIIISHNIHTVDITGGAPEMNPGLEWFISEIQGAGRRIIVRSNLVILLEEPYSHLIDFYTSNRVELAASLPDYSADKSERQRGDGFYLKVIHVIKMLNEIGYGRDGSGLLLNLVHNPVGAFLPGDQKSLEHEYRENLIKNNGIVFNKLFSISNMPVGRYLDYLIRSDNYEDYINSLCRNYNNNAVNNVMCKYTISVGWDGALYDCDFNQALSLKINHGAPQSIFDFDFNKLKERDIVINNHCYGCCAGSGSSCQGATV